MNAIIRNLKSLPGMLLSLLVLLIVLFWVLNMASKAGNVPVVGGPIASAAQFAEKHAQPY